MKKLLTVLLAVLMLLSLAACTDSQTGETTAPATEPPVNEPPRGNQVGQLCYSFQVETGTADGPTGEFADPTAAGKFTVINFWGTWCDPCKSELPHFDQFARDYDVKLYAIHSVDGKRKMPEYIEKNYPDSPIIFCYDEKSADAILDKNFLLLGGSTGYPYTVVLDENGVILYTHTGMMDYEQLKQLYESAQ